MAELVWYYARGDVERGPFTLPQIRALANASKLRPDDLVWKEGMEHWTAARDVAELFPPAGLVGDTSNSNGSEVASETRTSPATVDAKAARVMSGEMQGAFHRVARALALLGTVLVVATCGCESLGARRVTRLAAIAELSALGNATNAASEKQVAAQAALEHRANAFTRGVALQMGLLVLLAGAVGLMMLADRYERWLGVGLILIVIFSTLDSLTPGG